LRVSLEGIRLHGVRVAVSAGAPDPFVADLCVASIGIRPNAALAQAAGLAVRRGIVVDAAMRTSDPSIFAAGDAAEPPPGGATGLWPVGAAQGEIAAANALGDARAYEHAEQPMKLKCEGIDVFSFGNIDVAPPQSEIVSKFDAGAARRLVVRDGRILAACSVGEPGSSKALAAAVQESAAFDARLMV
jgi:nitrite reductase (NADH) large subunit